MSDIACLGCDSGTDSGYHWHGPVPNGLCGTSLKVWWKEQEKNIQCTVCDKQYPVDHDGEGFKNGKWYCAKCWDGM